VTVARARAVASHAIPLRPPVRVDVGDEVAVGERDDTWPAFVFVTCDKGEGWIPSRHLTASEGSATVRHAYDTTELPTTRGEELGVLRRDDDSGWLWCRNDVGREGWVPINTLVELD
jgi:D-aminopeptidase